MKKNEFLFTIVTAFVVGLFSGFCFFYLREVVNADDEDSVVLGNNSIKEEYIDYYNVDALKNPFSLYKYYNPKNIERYVNYFNKNNKFTVSKIVDNVNAGVDYDFYTHTKEADLSKDTLILVNKYNYLDEDYEPDNLVTIDEDYTLGWNNLMRKDAYEHFVEMADAANLEGIEIKNISAYRSYSMQEWLYEHYAEENDSYDIADTFSARAGFSEHQTGLALDINMVDDDFVKSPDYLWLKDNSYKYGFILRYPKDKESITGYKFEPWHYRYVGVEVATYIYNNDITFDEYYGYYINK